MHVYFMLWSLRAHVFSLRKGEACVSFLIPLRHRITLCFHALSDGIVSWMKPRSSFLCLERSQTLPKASPNCLSKTRCCGNNSSSCIGTSNDRPARRQIGSACCSSREWFGPGNRRSFIVQPESFARAARTLPCVLEAQIESPLEQAEALARDNQR